MDAATHRMATEVGARFAAVNGVVGVVIGGSVAIGADDAASDLDLGLYYHPVAQPETDDLNAVARLVDDRHPEAAITKFGEWGPWINGGGWLLVGGRRVDILFRDVQKVVNVIEDCKAGRVQWHYQPGHPHAFLNAIYLAELHYAVPLHDTGNTLAALKAMVAGYPPAMRREIIRQSRFEAAFALENAVKPASRTDTLHVAGCLYRCAASLTQALFAINSEYLMNEKGAAARVDRLAHRPPRFAATVNAILGHPGDTPERLSRSLARMAQLAAAVDRLCEESGAE